jgi:hypothetical protein
VADQMLQEQEEEELRMALLASEQAASMESPRSYAAQSESEQFSPPRRNGAAAARAAASSAAKDACGAGFATVSCSVCHDPRAPAQTVCTRCHEEAKECCVCLLLPSTVAALPCGETRSVTVCVCVW